MSIDQFEAGQKASLIPEPPEPIDCITLYEEFRLIERQEEEINTTWKGAHLLLFFLSFVFGSFCTFCFHVLMYLFDDKCVLFPKLMSLKEIPRGSDDTGIILDYIVGDRVLDILHVDFVTTQWVDISICYIPIYVPLLSGICGLVWTTMFLMCSSGSRTLTGFQRPWRILPSVFLFSTALGGLCMYATVITQAGLEQLCEKLAEITGKSSCLYTINVATLAYERRIRGVYQAVVLTILSAWLHTCCWVGAAILALVRILLLIDFRLVRVRADLKGNIEKMLERHEQHIRTDEFWLIKDDYTTTRPETESTRVRFSNKKNSNDESKESLEAFHFIATEPDYKSQTSICSLNNLIIASTSNSNTESNQIVIDFLSDMMAKVDDKIQMKESSNIGLRETSTTATLVMAEETELSYKDFRFQMKENYSKHDSKRSSETLLASSTNELLIKIISKHDQNSTKELPSIFSGEAYRRAKNLEGEARSEGVLSREVDDTTNFKVSSVGVVTVAETDPSKQSPEMREVFTQVSSDSEVSDRKKDSVDKETQKKPKEKQD